MIERIKQAIQSHYDQRLLCLEFLKGNTWHSESFGEEVDENYDTHRERHMITLDKILNIEIDVILTPNKGEYYWVNMEIMCRPDPYPRYGMLRSPHRWRKSAGFARDANVESVIQEMLTEAYCDTSMRGREWMFRG